MTILSTEPRFKGLRKVSDVSQTPSSMMSPSIYTNGQSVAAAVHAMPRPGPSNLLSRFIEQFRELEAYKYINSYLLYHTASNHTSALRRGKSIVVDGHSLSIPALVAAARHNASIVLNGSSEIRARIQKSRDVIVEKVETSQSVYGVSTGFGGSGKTSSQTTILRLSLNLVSSQPIHARRTPWLLEVHYCNTNMQVFCHLPQTSSLPFLCSIPSLLPACRNHGFVERS
jgi:hypothetical protein